MADSPSEIDKKTVKEFKIQPKHEIAKDVKLAYIQEQVTALKQTIWRTRIDILHAQRLMDDENEIMQSKGHEQMTNHRNSLKQFLGAVDTLVLLQEEMEA